MANVSDDVADEVNSDVSILEMSLSEAEEKIAGLLQLKEKLVVVQVWHFISSFVLITLTPRFVVYRLIIADWRRT